jgi:hypothetical protein
LRVARAVVLPKVLPQVAVVLAGIGLALAQVVVAHLLKLH